MALRLPQAELWIQTAPCEVRSDCQLARYHLHVEDQIYYDFAEMDRIFGKNGWEVAEEPVKADDSAMDKIKGWINVGFTTSPHSFKPQPVSDHRNHVHIAVTDPTNPPDPGTLMTWDQNGKMRVAVQGDPVAGVMTRQVPSDHSPGRAMDIQVSGSWRMDEEIAVAARLLRNTQIVQ
jgi:hypothetical protein